MNKFSPEVRERAVSRGQRAVRIVQKRRGEYASLWLAVELIALMNRVRAADAADLD